MRPFLIALLAAISIGLIVFAAFFLRPTVSIAVQPATAKITFSGRSVVGQGKFTVLPGSHELAIEQEGYILLRRTERLRVGQRLHYTITLKQTPKPTATTTEPVLLVDVSLDTKSVVYVGNQGKTLFSQNGGTQKALTPDSFKEPASFSMSPEQDVAILRNPNGELFLHDFKRYNLVEQEQFLYGRDIGGIAWVYPDGTQLLYSYAPTSGERSLILADRTNKNIERVLNLQEAGISDPTVSVAPDATTAVLVSRPGSDFKEYNMFLFDLFTKRARQLTTDGSKVDARFSPSGKHIIYTRFEADPDGINNQLISIMDLDGRNRKDFNLRATLDQIAFLDDTHLVVAVSKKTGSSLVRLDLVSGEESRFYHEQPIAFHLSKIVLAGDGKSVYATGSSQPREKYGTLYQVTLETDEYE